MHNEVDESPATAEDSLDGKKSAAAKSAIWYTLASFTTKGLGFITIPLFTRIMTTAEFSSFNNYAAWQQILLSIFGLESYLTINRARFDFDKRELQGYQFSVLGVGAVFTLFLAAVMAIAPKLSEGITALDMQYLIIMLLYILFYPSFAMFQSLQRVQYRYKLSAGLSFGVSLGATLLSVVLVVSLSDALMGRIVGQYVPFIVLGTGFFIWYAATGRKVQGKYIRYALPLCIPLVIATCGSQVLLLGCRIISQHFCASDGAAFVSLATTCSQIALVLTTALNNAWSPWLMDCLNVRRYDEARKAFSIFLWGICLTTLGVSFLAPELVGILGGQDYGPTIALIPSFMCACLLNMISSQYVFVETFYKRVKLGGVVTLLIGLANLGICAYLATVFGYAGVGYGNIVSYVLLIVLHKIVVRRFDSPDIFDLKLIGVPVALSVGSMPVCLALYSSGTTVPRMICFVLCAIAGAWILLSNMKGLRGKKAVS